MNKKQKAVQQQHLKNEKKIIQQLEKIYTDAAKDCEAKIKQLASRTDMQNLQSIVYQMQYQQALKKQLEGILDTLHTNQFTDISKYLEESYENGFYGTLYDLHGQGVPVIFPIDQRQVIKALQTDTKLSKSLYSKLGEDVNSLKKSISAELSRGIANGSTWLDMATQIASGMNSPFNKATNNAMRITRTEGHRIQNQAQWDTLNHARNRGADIVKQWDSTLDKRTRRNHMKLDGQIRELDEPFEVDGKKAMMPGGFGIASEDIHCRCCMGQRASWALDEDELKELQDRAAYFGLDKAQSFEDFKQKYIGAVAAPAVKPKKEYLTKKKLEQKLSDAQTQMDNLVQQQNSTNDKTLYLDLQKKIDDLQQQMDEWDELLQKKLVAAETKALKKQQILLQDQIDNFDISKTYSNIWKDDVSVLDWKAKHGSIAAKKQYFENKLIYASDIDEANKWKALLDNLDDFDKQGKAYWNLQDQMKQTQAELTSLSKCSTIKSKELEAFTQDRKDAALWAKSTKEADAELRDTCGKVWRNASSSEKYAIYDYTSGSGKFNRPLSGFEKPYYEFGSGWEQKYFKGINNVWIDYEGAGDEIRHMTNLISQSSYDFDMWLQRGCDGNAMESFLGLASDTFEYMSDSELQQFVGRSNRMYSFTSCGVSKGMGFSSKPVILNVYAPKGTQMMYAEPFSAFSGQGGKNWDGITSQSYFGSESEMIIQRGASYTITKIEKSGGTIYIDMEVHPEQGYDTFQQDPAEWTGSTKKGR